MFSKYFAILVVGNVLNFVNQFFLTIAISFAPSGLSGTAGMVVKSKSAGKMPAVQDYPRLAAGGFLCV